MLRWLQDQVLAALQRRCTHPGEMVAADVFEGDIPNTRVAYCRRCGALRTIRGLAASVWRRPDPNLWRGR